MANITIKDLNPTLTFCKTATAGDVIVNSSSALVQVVKTSETVRGNVKVLSPDLTTLVTVNPGDTSVALAAGDYYFYGTENAQTTIPAPVVA